MKLIEQMIELRKHKGISIEELSIQTNIEQTALIKLENGDTSLCLKELTKIAKVLGASIRLVLVEGGK